MKDRLAKYPGRYTAIVDTEKIEKGIPFNINITRDDEPTVEGTPYNKESVLPDSVAEAICPDVEDPTPADAFMALHNGKAPAGYSLGEQNATVYNWDRQNRNGFYRDNKNSPDNINIWYGVTCSSYSGETTNLAFSPEFADGAIMAIRHKKNNVLAEWEYVNPPMLEGVEYRTTERFNGKPVYIKLVNCGYLPNNSTKTVAHGIVGLDLCFAHGGAFRGYISIPHKSGINNTTVDVIKINISDITIATSVDYSQYAGYVWLKYTKEEEE